MYEDFLWGGDYISFNMLHNLYRVRVEWLYKFLWYDNSI